MAGYVLCTVECTAGCRIQWIVCDKMARYRDIAEYQGYAIRNGKIPRNSNKFNKQDTGVIQVYRREIPKIHVKGGLLQAYRRRCNCFTLVD